MGSNVPLCLIPRSMLILFVSVFGLIIAVAFGYMILSIFQKRWSILLFNYFVIAECSFPFWFVEVVICRCLFYFLIIWSMLPFSSIFLSWCIIVLFKTVTLSLLSIFLLHCRLCLLLRVLVLVSFYGFHSFFFYFRSYFCC